LGFAVRPDRLPAPGQTGRSFFAAGRYTDVTLSGDFAADPKQVTVTFINGLYEGTPQTDRKLYVESLSIDSHIFLGSAAADPIGNAVGGAAALYRDGTITFDVQPAKLQTLRVAAYAFMGGAEFKVAVDGVQVGGIFLANRSFAAGQFQDITLVGNFGPDPKRVSVSFVNELYEGSPSTDRKLYVESLTLDGRTMPGSAATNPVGKPVGRATVLYAYGTITFTLPPITSPSEPGGQGRAYLASPPPVSAHPVSPRDIRILPAIAARGFTLADAEPEVEPWVVSLVRGHAAVHGAGGGRNSVVVDLSAQKAKPCAS